MRRWPFPGTSSASSEPITAETMPAGAVTATTRQRISPSLVYRAVPVTALGKIEGRVVPTARSAGTPSARMAGVDTTAPPTPNEADSTPVPTPTMTVSTSLSGPGSMGGLSTVRTWPYWNPLSRSST